ncbi:dihydrofolate reductase [Crossiella equi]|uniref:Dihydrofolate reductase n=1 Tax=Crossiella equi TaxID=130796 RepID=A0ABS5A6C6_9PSEU|nr:dihydrofolate reductase family protein [Crossiella equi]MBP2472140.1 dihydrofolate reductase [Crossiella equi]
MAMVITGATTSLDGYVADHNDGVELLFRWYDNGDVPISTTHEELGFRLTQVSADHFRTLVEDTGALVVGRRLFDLTNGWGGEHPLGCPVVVLTHSVPEGWSEVGERFVFVTTGIADAVAKAKELAGEKIVGVAAGVTGGQALDAGLVDEVWIDLAPVVLGGGVPYFAGLEKGPYVLEDPYSIVQGKGVTHLKYRVRPA